MPVSDKFGGIAVETDQFGGVPVEEPGFDLTEAIAQFDPYRDVRAIDPGFDPNRFVPPEDQTVAQELAGAAGNAAGMVNRGIGDASRTFLNLLHSPLYLIDRLTGNKEADPFPFKEGKPIIPPPSGPVLPSNFLPFLSPESNEALRGFTDESARQLAEMSTPENVGLAFATPGVGMLSKPLANLGAKAIGSYFTSQIASELPQLAAESGTTLGDINTSGTEAGRAIAKVAVPTALGLGLYHGMTEPKITPTTRQTVTPVLPPRFRANWPTEALNRMAQRASDVRAVEAGSPFVRAEPATGAPVPYQLGQPVPQWVEPSGLNLVREPVVRQPMPADIPASPELKAQVGVGGGENAKAAQGEVPLSPDVESFTRQITEPGARAPSTEGAQKAGMASKTISDLEHLMAERRKLTVEKDKALELARSAKTAEESQAALEKLSYYASGRTQLPREAIETATNSGSAKGGGIGTEKLGERPLDWRTNPEARAWLEKNGQELWGKDSEAWESFREEASEFKPGGSLDVQGDYYTSPEFGKPYFGKPRQLPEQPKPAENLQPTRQAEAVPEPIVESVTALDPQSGSPLSATEALINKLEAAGQPLVEWADQTIKRSKSAGIRPVGGPELLAAWTIKGAQIIGRGIKTFKEWSAEMLKEYGPKIKDQLNQIWTQSNALRERQAGLAAEPMGGAGGPAVEATGAPVAGREAGTMGAGAGPGVTEAVQGETVKMRKLSERGTTAKSIPAPVRQQIKAAPESRYRQQSVPKVQELVRSMSDQELSAVGKDSDLYTAARLEQANRLFDAGNDAGGYRVFQDLSQELTRLGQVVNQAKLLNALQPENVVKVVNKSLEQAKRDPLTSVQAEKLKGLSKSRIDAERITDLATDKWLAEPNDVNAAAAEKALMDANRAAIEEQRMVHNFQGRSMASLLKSILQGNLLTPISQVANAFGNVSFLPFRAAGRTGAAMVDTLDSYIRNRPRQVSVAPVSGTLEAGKGLVRGLKQIPDILMRGTGDVIKGEKRASLHPLRAWVKQFAADPEVPTVGGKIPFSERVKLAIEGTLGAPAEIMLRGLGAGDIGFREAARARLIAEQSRLQGLPKDQLRMAQNFPELFFDRKTLARIEAETRGAIFQRESKTLGHLMSWLKGSGDKFDLLTSTIAPYKLTPWNIVGEILSYNPLIAMGRTALEAKRGNARAAEMNAAKVVIGSTLAYAGYWLYSKGLLAPSMDSGDEVQKARVLAGKVLPPNHINISGLKRALTGGDPAFQPGDTTWDVFRAGGLAGSMFYMAANTGRDIELKPEADNAILSILKNSTIEQARFGLNQSFLKGVNGLLSAVHEGETDNFIQSYANTVLSIPLPNTLSALSRANREYKVDAKGQNFGKQLENVVRTRLGFMGLDDYLPLKRGLWGEPLTETPKDRNALVYHFFDITKGQQVTDDSVPLELYRLWRKTANTSVIPSPPEKTFTFAKSTYLLTPEQQSLLAELVGKQRKPVMDKLVINPNWHELPDEAKLKVLKRVYDRGLDVGKGLFWLDPNRGELIEKPARAGFQAQ